MKSRSDSTGDELMLIGALLHKPEMWRKVASVVSLADFASPRVAGVFEAMTYCHAKHGTFDASMVESRLDILEDGIQRDEWINTIKEAWQYAISGDNADKYALIVREASLRRTIHSDCMKIASMAETGADVADLIAGLRASAISSSAVVKADANTRPAADIVTAIIDRIEANKGKPPMMGLQTGIYDLDSKTTGFHPGELIIGAARPGMGKTTLALNIMRHMGENDIPCLMFSLEMTGENVISNILAATGKINGQYFRMSQMSNQDMERLLKASESLYGAPIYICDSSAMKIGDMQSVAYDYHQRHGIKAVIVDYLQLAKSTGGKGRSREQEVSEVSQGLKAMAKDLKIPVIALAQLNRETEKRSGAVPLLSDLRESGSIEQDADCVLLLHRPEYYDAASKRQGELDIYISKQRNGPTGMVTAAYKGQYFRIDNLALPHPEDDHDSREF